MTTRFLEPRDDVSDRFAYLSSSSVITSSAPSRTYSFLSAYFSNSQQNPAPLLETPTSPTFTPEELVDELAREAGRSEAFKACLKDLLRWEEGYQKELSKLWLTSRKQLLDLTHPPTGGNGWLKRQIRSSNNLLNEQDVECIFEGLSQVLTWHVKLLHVLYRCLREQELGEMSLNLAELDSYVGFACNHLKSMLTVEKVYRKSPKAAQIVDNEEFFSCLTSPFDHLPDLAESLTHLANLDIRLSKRQVSSGWHDLIRSIQQTHKQVRDILDSMHSRLLVLDVQAQFLSLPSLALTDSDERYLVRDDRVFFRKVGPILGDRVSERWFLFSDLVVRSREVNATGQLKWKEHAKIHSSGLQYFPVDNAQLTNGFCLRMPSCHEEFVAEFNDAAARDAWLYSLYRLTGIPPQSNNTLISTGQAFQAFIPPSSIKQSATPAMQKRTSSGAVRPSVEGIFRVNITPTPSSPSVYNRNSASVSNLVLTSSKTAPTPLPARRRLHNRNQSLPENSFTSLKGRSSVYSSDSSSEALTSKTSSLGLTIATRTRVAFPGLDDVEEAKLKTKKSGSSAKAWLFGVKSSKRPISG